MASFRFSCGILRKILESLSYMADEANVFFEPDRGLRFKLVCFVGDVDGAVYFRKESLGDFLCPRRISACVELMQLEKGLAAIGTDDFVDLHFDPDKLMVLICAEKFGRPLTAEKLLTEPTEVRVIEVLLMEERSEFMKIDESKFEYDWVIGIPSIQFRHMLEDAEAHHFVTIYVKDSEVWFKVKNRAFVLHKEANVLKVFLDPNLSIPLFSLHLGNFVSVGPTFDKPVAVEFALYRRGTFLTASHLTNMVWLCWSSDAPPLLIFPVGRFGNIHIYSRLFPEKKPKRVLQST